VTGDPTTQRGLVAQWTKAWASILDERRTGSGKLGVAGAYAGAVAGAVFAPVSLLLVELFGLASSTSVLAWLFMPIYMFCFGIAGAVAIGGIAALAAVFPGVSTAGASLTGERKAIRWAGWVGSVVGVLTAAANFYAETTNR
jgi:hypothetical protein